MKLVDPTYTLYLMYLGKEEMYKIGITGNLDQRVRNFRRSNPWLELTHAAPAGIDETIVRKCEQEMHQFYKEQRAFEGRNHREVFKFDIRKVQSVICSLDNVTEALAKKD